MRVIYNIVLVAVHVVGIVFLTAISTSRFIFWATWTKYNELTFIIWASLVYILHYSLLWHGYKKKLIEIRASCALQIIERILFIPQFVFLILSYIKSFILGPIPKVIPLSFSIPLLIIFMVYLITRNVINNYL